MFILKIQILKGFICPLNLYCRTENHNDIIMKIIKDDSESDQ